MYLIISLFGVFYCQGAVKITLCHCKSRVINPTSTPTNKTSIEPTPTPKPPTPISQATSPPQVVESGNPGVSIKVFDDSNIKGNAQGKTQIQFLAGTQPLDGISVNFFPTEKDITGKWSAPFGSAGSQIYRTDNNGSLEASLDPGNYAVKNRDRTAVWNQLMGKWGVEVSDLQSIIVPVFPGKRTEVEVVLGLLEVGVIKNGKAYEDAFVEAKCLDKDIAGNTRLISCDGSHDWRRTDYTGVTALNLGEGKYVIQIRAVDYYYTPEIVIKAGETRQEIYRLDQMQAYRNSIADH